MNNSEDILWPYEPEEDSPRDEFDEADMMYSEKKLEKLNKDD